MKTKKLNKTPIRAYLAHRNIHPAKDRGHYGMYRSPFREDNTPSMKVSYKENLWIDYGAGEGGTLIDLVMRIENCDVASAIRHLESTMPDLSSFSFHKQSFNNPLKSDSSIAITNVKPIENPALIAYLQKRGIDINIAQKYCSEVHYTVNTKPYFAIGFKNDEGGYELRNKYFKGCTSKAPTTFDNKSDECLVFEGFIDFLSYLTLKRAGNSKFNVAVLNSVNNLSKAKEFIVSHNVVHTFLDNDEQGHKVTAELKQVCKSLVDYLDRYSSYKDLNDYLIEYKSQRKSTKNLRAKRLKF